MENHNELLELIQTIKSHSEPPRNEDDIYNMRYPWQKFGGVSSGICMCWCWYRDDVILEKATKADMLFALNEFDKQSQN